MNRRSKFKKTTYLEILFGLSIIEKLTLIISIPLLIFIMRMLLGYE